MAVEQPASAELAVSTVIFALRAQPASGPDTELPSLWLPLVRRTREPFEGQWALPGGWLPVDEELGRAAARTLRETTGLAPKYLEQLYSFGALDRSPGRRVVSVVYWALVQSDEAARAAVGENVQWFPADDLPELAFDHNLIVDYALWRLRTKLEYSRIAHAFLGETFTLAQLREVHEAVLQRPLDPANFRRTIEASKTVIATDEYLAGTPHRPPRLYRFDSTIDPADLGPLGRATPGKAS
ncbi:ADP-ribose pyrophosphatase YjhB (NUDIX family) [Microterricola gilva]|uniref:ADP-ribose pyrophosphatase YjhB (NUDIX family) n=1 Tax=Microterricola gilva TaxID=393267 RepID=A0A4V2GAW2_9MICO|nr:NUDIX domain-containing protein [Microterricola gilva]RZU65836.1 ADP-ribose pyrophosphatase YjhB (NUDIX family) [Microterricola gilva]